MGMFCYQCEQTSKCTACTTIGVCGKDPKTASLQDLLIHISKGIAAYYNPVMQKDIRSQEIEDALLDYLFITLTNVNFDSEAIARYCDQALLMREKAKELFSLSINEPINLPELVNFDASGSVADKASKGLKTSIKNRIEEFGETITGLQELIIYGLKGSAAYAHHANMLEYRNPEINKILVDIMAFLATNSTDTNTLLGYALKAGEMNFLVMELLDKANTETYGHPEPTKVSTTGKTGKAILVSGHDLHDLYLLLQQTVGTGINIYTHGEMLPCLAYPKLKEFPHLKGNWGGAWQDQQKEFKEFPGAILMTTNCIQDPIEYSDKIFTTGLVGWKGITHIDENKDFTPVVKKALELDGFKEDEADTEITIGFGHNAVLSVADTVINAVKDGAIKHFLLVGGCDGAKSGRNYYTEMAETIPDDCVILTLACGKFRFNKKEFGNIGSIPRLLDIGQCNDAYSAVKIALALANAFECEVNELPLSLILSWYEQKAVAILLTLLHLGIKNIKLGPSLPAFITEDVLNILVENYAIAPIGTVKEDLDKILSA